jgi:catechol 2,3-dioxygenase-like lactoylglutathione lyase family enzyme
MAESPLNSPWQQNRSHACDSFGLTLKGRDMSSIIDHVTLGVSDFDTARHFYDRVMPALGFRRLWEKPSMNAYGVEGADDFGLQLDDCSSRRGTHVAFRAPDRASVNRFHSEALAAGGRDDGAPGLRPEYHGSYYAAFVIDPDGNRIEAVCHEPDGP